MKHLGRTPQFRGPKGEILPDSIAEIGYLSLGGLDQWIMIRGESIANPLLVFLHGGPGFPGTRHFRHFNAPLEKSFTVVYWEQRGTGKSFNCRIPRSSMNIERFVSDLDELVDSVCKRFSAPKVVIYGHSWGSALGVLYCARFPEKVSVYVGTGQIGDLQASELLSYAFALTEAKRRENSKALTELRKIGAPPYNGRTLQVERKWLLRFIGRTSLWKLLRVILGGAEVSIFDLPNIFSVNAMWPEVSVLNLIKVAPELRMPVFFFLGRHDQMVDASTSATYFDILTAPSKRLLWFEESGHEPASEEPAKFNAAMAELVRPIAIGPRPAAE